MLIFNPYSYVFCLLIYFVKLLSIIRFWIFNIFIYDFMFLYMFMCLCLCLEFSINVFLFINTIFSIALYLPKAINNTKIQDYSTIYCRICVFSQIQSVFLHDGSSYFTLKSSNLLSNSIFHTHIFSLWKWNFQFTFLFKCTTIKIWVWTKRQLNCFFYAYL